MTQRRSAVLLLLAAIALAPACKKAQSPCDGVDQTDINSTIRCYYSDKVGSRIDWLADSQREGAPKGWSESRNWVATGLKVLATEPVGSIEYAAVAVGRQKKACSDSTVTVWKRDSGRWRIASSGAVLDAANEAEDREDYAAAFSLLANELRDDPLSTDAFFRLAYLRWLTKSEVPAMDAAMVSAGLRRFGANESFNVIIDGYITDDPVEAARKFGSLPPETCQIGEFVIRRAARIENKELRSAFMDAVAPSFPEVVAWNTLTELETGPAGATWAGAQGLSAGAVARFSDAVGTLSVERGSALAYLMAGAALKANISSGSNTRPSMALEKGPLGSPMVWVEKGLTRAPDHKALTKLKAELNEISHASMGRFDVKIDTYEIGDPRRAPPPAFLGELAELCRAQEKEFSAARNEIQERQTLKSFLARATRLVAGKRVEGARGLVTKLDVAPFGDAFWFGISVDGIQFETGPFDRQMLTPDRGVGVKAARTRKGDRVVFDGVVERAVTEKHSPFSQGEACWSLVTTFRDITASR